MDMVIVIVMVVYHIDSKRCETLAIRFDFLLQTVFSSNELQWMITVVVHIKSLAYPNTA